jgi:hypothetical protein
MKTGVWIKHDGSDKCPIDGDLKCRIKSRMGTFKDYELANYWFWGGVLEYMIKPQSIDDATPEEWDEISKRKMNLNMQPIIDDSFKAQQSTNSALDIQIQGNHYKQFKIQPVEFIHANNIPFVKPMP